MFPSVWDSLDCSVKESFPELESVNSASQVSKVLFGVKTMTHLIGMDADDCETLKAFFAGNPSGMVEWARHAKPGSFHAVPERHAGAYRAMVAKLGLPLTVALTQNRDFQDIVVGFNFVISDKKAWNRFKVDILDSLHLFPSGHCHAVMIHDYLNSRMARADRVSAPRTPTLARPLPLPTLSAPFEDSDFRVLFPANDSDLKRIGNAQNHCVGTRQMGYGEKIRRGEVIIFAVYQKSLGDGVCIEIDASDRDVLQAQGKLRRAPSVAEQKIIDRVINLIKFE